MMMAVKMCGVVGVSSAALLYFEHHQVTSAWKKHHPLIDSCLDLVIKNPQIQKAIGAPVRKTDSINGVLEPNKPWANLALEVRGTEGSAKVTLMADGKLEAEEGLMSFEYPRNFSIYEQLKARVGRTDLKDEQYNWKVISMHAKLNDVTTFPIIVQGRLANTQQETTAEVAAVQETTEPTEPTQLTSDELLMARKRKQMQVASQRWKQILTAIGVGGFGFVVGRHFLRINPIGRTSFMSQALEHLKTSDKLKAELGVPVQASESPQGYLNYNMTKGYAKVVVHGPKGFGRVMIRGHIADKQWKYSEMTLLRSSGRESLL
jgi:hypothetical protein